ncbi:MAG: antibiotic biosynthesis monooxygenase [Actinomycetota bacterium]|nr:MAG: antibiotic biosynthesis monooxygenase [Actinomycetota bacterium]
MIAVSRFVVTALDEPAFVEQAGVAVAALAARPGFVRAHVGRALDDPSAFLLQTQWSDVGSYRRALSSMDVKIAAVPLLSRALDEPSAYEILLAADGSGTVRSASDRAADAATVGLGALPPPSPDTRPAGSGGR